MKHRIEYALVRGGLSLGNIFPWDWISKAGAILGLFCYHVLRVRRRVVLENLELALGETRAHDELQCIARACYVQIGRSYMEYFGLPALRRRRVLERITYTGLEHLEAARARGKGVLFMGAHFGNWELGALAILELGIPLHIIVGDLANPAVDQAMNDMRRRLGIPIEHRGMGLRNVIKAMRAGHGVGVQGDQEARWHGVIVPFFGRESLTHPGGAYLSLKTGAPILPSFLLREGRGFRLVFLEPLFPGPEASEDAVRQLSAEHTSRLEGMIRRHPEQWFWHHKRWKRAPKGPDGLPRRAAGEGA